jgi:hypothetical protein
LEEKKFNQTPQKNVNKMENDLSSRIVEYKKKASELKSDSYEESYRKIYNSKGVGIGIDEFLNGNYQIKDSIRVTKTLERNGIVLNNATYSMADLAAFCGAVKIKITYSKAPGVFYAEPFKIDAESDTIRSAGSKIPVTSNGIYMLLKIAGYTIKEFEIDDSGINQTAEKVFPLFEFNSDMSYNAFHAVNRIIVPKSMFDCKRYPSVNPYEDNNNNSNDYDSNADEWSELDATGDECIKCITLEMMVKQLKCLFIISSTKQLAMLNDDNELEYTAFEDADLSYVRRMFLPQFKIANG